jgi:hypothetical protein
LPLLAIGSSACVIAGPAKTPEGVVREYVSDWNAEDLKAFLALYTPDAKIFRHDDTSDKLETSGKDQLRQRYEKVFAKKPHVHVEIVSTATVGGFVLNHERVTGLPDGRISDETSLYQVDHGLIRAIWHLGRVVA